MIRLRAAIVVLLVGAAINVLVAWLGCVRVIRASDPFVNVHQAVTDEVKTDARLWLLAHVPAYRDQPWRLQSLDRYESCLAAEELDISGTTYMPGESQVMAHRVRTTRLSAGWPLYSLDGSTWSMTSFAHFSGGSQSQSTFNSWVVTLPTSPVRLGDYFISRPAEVPLRPIVSGFVVNSLFYALIAATIFSARYLDHNRTVRGYRRAERADVVRDFAVR